MPPLPHHRAYGSRTRRFDWVLSWVRNKKSRETERVEVVVTQGLLDRWVSGYALQESARQMRGIAPAQAPGTKISICHGVGDMICRQQHDHHVE